MGRLTEHGRQPPPLNNLANLLLRLPADPTAEASERHTRTLVRCHQRC